MKKVVIAGVLACSLLVSGCEQVKETAFTAKDWVVEKYNDLMGDGSGSSKTEEVSVQSVSMLTGFSDLGTMQRFSGMVVSRGEVTVEPDPSKKIKEVKVEVGDVVEPDQVLLKYDMEFAELDLQKAELELEQMKIGVEQKLTSRAKLEEEKAKAKPEEQLSYSLEIQSMDAEIREDNYNISLKEADIQQLKKSLKIKRLRSPIAGTIKQIGDPDQGGYDDSISKIVITEAGTYRVMGYMSETNMGAIYEGMPVILNSRVNDDSWTGYVSMIDWENPKTGGDDYYYYGGDEMNSPSKYPFYVELDDSASLMLGQHVYIEEANMNAEEQEGMALSKAFLFNIGDSTASVWAEGIKGKLEKREVTLGAYNEDADTYIIEKGLEASDYIAWPDETLKEGMICVRFDENAFEGGFDDGYFEGDWEDGNFEGDWEDGNFEGDWEDGNFEGDWEDGNFEGNFEEGFEEENFEDGDFEGNFEDGSEE